MTRDEIRDLVDAWARAVAACDIDALERLVGPSLREGIVQRTRAAHTAFKDVVVTPVQVLIDADNVAWRWRLTGTHVGAIGGVAPSGQRESIEGVNFQRVRDGAVVEHWTTVDIGPLARRASS
jgi:predicted ester cyclase